jgi:hypothetical protein
MEGITAGDLIPKILRRGIQVMLEAAVLAFVGCLGRNQWIGMGNSDAEGPVAYRHPAGYLRCPPMTHQGDYTDFPPGLQLHEVPGAIPAHLPQPRP